MSQAPTDPNRPGGPMPDDAGLDAAQQSLSDALRVSFAVLKVLMVALFVVYLFSGVFRVEENEVGVRYRFGKEVDTHPPGWHIGWPFPIDNLVTVPGNPQTVQLDQSFWYHNPEGRSPEQLAGRGLNPLEDNFLITGDGNVVHVQFAIEYEIDSGQVEQYLRNVGSIEQAERIVRTAGERGMIHSIASRNIEDIINKSDFKKEDIRARVQQVLTNLGTGITVRQVLIDNQNQSMPNQVRQAYEEVTRAQADKVNSIQAARRTYDQTLGAAAGGAHPELLQMIRAYEAALGNQQDELSRALRVELNRSIRELRLPPVEVLSRIQAYLGAATAAAGSSEPTALARLDEAADDLTAALAALPEGREIGTPITGEIAAAISSARANRSEIATRARLDYERYASALETFRKAPLVLANDRLQSTREAVMGGDVLVQTIIGPIQRIDTNADPEVQEEIAEQGLEDRRRRAQEQEAEGR